MITEEQKQNIIRALQQWLDTPGEGRTQADIAAKTGLSKGMVSQLAKGNTVIGASPIGEAHFLKLNDVLMVPLVKPVLHWQTTKLRTIAGHLDRAKNRAIRMVIAGNTGISKTYTSRWYARNQNRVACIRLTTEMGKRELLNELVERMQLNPERAGGKAVMNALEKKVTAESGWLIIIDEGEDKKNALYRVIKEISDCVEGKAGVVMFGIDLIAKLGRLAQHKRTDMPQLCSRFFPYSVEMDAFSGDDTAEVLDLMGISDKPLRQWLIEESTDYRFLHTYISDLQEVAGDRPLTIGVLEELFAA